MKLKASFFNRNSVEVAKELVGKYLVKATADGKLHRFLITEVEAYDGEADLACHASKGRNKKTEVLYWEAGTFYVYLVYGMYWMLNVVCDKKDYPSAVLIRGIEEIDGPGRITKSLGIDRALHGVHVHRSLSLWFEDSKKAKTKIQKKIIKSTPRIGVDYAGMEWSQKPYRFVLTD
jgi:DNA-3-methyladenine glycosylase